ncbi:MAG TPA: FadR/GntR family transcriptional regulator [Thermoanaerobaculia bacterium]|nr:FadR/GntR family transcriptional regulator [Thermoanaerobaculia bacterium]
MLKRRTGRVSESIAKRIQRAISVGKLEPGEKLPAERDLARKLNVSRVSVREAYRSLEELGLLLVKRGAEGGAFISDVDHEPVTRSLSLMLRLGRTTHAELTEARLLLEPPIARLAALRAEPKDIARLEDMVAKQEQALKGNGNPRRYDMQFHRLVAESAKNLPLMIVMNSLADLELEAISSIDISANVKRHTIHFHQSVLDAIRRADGDAAFETMLRHILDVQSRLGKAFERQLGG